jgi:hypothetical protein
MASKPIDAVILPVPLIKPVTVPNDLLFPWTDGCEAKSAATADVIILLGLYHEKQIKNVRVCPIASLQAMKIVPVLTLRQGYPYNQALLREQLVGCRLRNRQRRHQGRQPMYT